MRLRAALVLLALGCSRPLNGPLEDLDAALDAADARAFLARWRDLGRQKAPAAAARRADLALEALASGQAHRLPGITAAQLEAQGERDAERAAREAPGQAAGWRALARYRFRRGREGEAAAAACRAADLAPKCADDQESCGDLLRALGDAAGAVARYQAAFPTSRDREQQFELIARIEATSLTPAADVAALPPEIVAQYRQAQARVQPLPPPALLLEPPPEPMAPPEAGAPWQ